MMKEIFSEKNFYVIVVLYFWIVFISQPRALFSVLGHLWPVPPTAAVEKFMDVPIKGSVMGELETLCLASGSTPTSISWDDYNAMLDLARPEYDPAWMMFEKFYDQHACPVRVRQDGSERFGATILFVEPGKEVMTDIVIKRTKNLALVRRN